jgi:hypothetical protein
LLRAGAIDLDTALGYSTNPGNLRLELADLVDADVHAKTDSAPAEVEVDR